MAVFGHVITAMVTPMDRSLAVDYGRAAALAKRLVDHGSDGLVVCGTTGESPTLSDEEKIRLWHTVREAVGTRAQVIAGTGTYNTAHSIHLTKEAERAGCDGVLLVNPYYNKPSQEGLYQHFKAVAESTRLPIMLYNIQGRTSVNCEPATSAGSCARTRPKLSRSCCTWNARLPRTPRNPPMWWSASKPTVTCGWGR